jgi:hypothetical protein
MHLIEYAAVAAALFFAATWALGLALRPEQRLKSTVVTVAYWWLALLLVLGGMFNVLHLVWLFPFALAVPGAIQGNVLRRQLAHPSFRSVFLSSSAILIPTLVALAYLSEGEFMSTVLWIAIALVSLPLAWWLLKVVTAFAVPQRLAGIALFKQELSKLGIPHAHLPSEFFEECIGWSERVSSFTGRKSAIERKAEFVRSIESLAHMVYLWRTEPNSPMFAQHGSQPSGYRTLFEKYNLK